MSKLSTKSNPNWSGMKYWNYFDFFIILKIFGYKIKSYLLFSWWELVNSGLGCESDSFHYSFSTYHFAFACTTQTRFFATISFAFCLQTFTVILSVWRNMLARMFLTNSVDFFTFCFSYTLHRRQLKKVTSPKWFPRIGCGNFGFYFYFT